jgi:hypothetical protein
MTRSDVSLIDKSAEISLEENPRTTGSADPISESDSLHINTLFTSKNVSGVKELVV